MYCSSLRRRRNNTAKNSRGFTLLEILVVLVIVGLISSLLMQGFMYMAGIYSVVERRQRAVQAEELLHGWFTDSVSGLINGLDGKLYSGAPFNGDAEGFRALGLTALTYAGGVTRPLQVEWALIQQDDALTLQYRELPSHSEPSDWHSLRRWPGAEGGFEYLSDGQWASSFPATSALFAGQDQQVQLPDAIRLRVSSARGVTDVIAHLGVSRLEYRAPRPSGDLL